MFHMELFSGEWMNERMNTKMGGWMDGYRIEITYLFLVVQQTYLALGSLRVHVSRSHSERHNFQ